MSSGARWWAQAAVGGLWESERMGRGGRGGIEKAGGGVGGGLVMSIVFLGVGVGCWGCFSGRKK